MKKISLFISIVLISVYAYASYIIPNGSVTNAKIANGAVSAAKISSIPDNSVSTAKILDDAVTFSKIAARPYVSGFNLSTGTSSATWVPIATISYAAFPSVAGINVIQVYSTKLTVGTSPSAGGNICANGGTGYIGYDFNSNCSNTLSVSSFSGCLTQMQWFFSSSSASGTVYLCGAVSAGNMAISDMAALFYRMR